MQIGFNSYSLYDYSPRLSENNSESRQKRQNNNYDLTFGQSKLEKFGLFCIKVVCGTIFSMILLTLMKNSTPEQNRNTNSHPNGKEKTVQGGAKAPTEGTSMKQMEKEILEIWEQTKNEGVSTPTTTPTRYEKAFTDAIEKAKKSPKRSREELRKMGKVFIRAFEEAK